MFPPVPHPISRAPPPPGCAESGAARGTTSASPRGRPEARRRRPSEARSGRSWRSGDWWVGTGRLRIPRRATRRRAATVTSREHSRPARPPHETRTSIMPSPVGHSLAGLIAYQIAPEIDGLARRQVIAWYLLAANAPDLDFLPGLMAGDPNRFHHGVSHSSGLALLFAIAVSLLLRLRQREWRWKQFFVFLGLWLSHLILDYLSEDSSPPYGRSEERRVG